MPTSMTLQLKISATRKRLSNGFLPAICISVIALVAVLYALIFLARPISMGGDYGIVELDIPILSVPLADKGLASVREEAGETLDQSTLVVALTPSEFIFGDLAGFTTLSGDVRSKFVLKHNEGSPQVSDLLKTIDAWQDDRSRRLGLRSNRLLILLPDSRVPLNIVIQVSSLLKSSQKFNKIILAGGLQA